MPQEPQPCAKFRKADIVRWVTHINRGECKKCLELARYFERESQKNMFLRAHRN
jgi:hypothetical protein